MDSVTRHERNLNIAALLSRLNEATEDLYRADEARKTAQTSLDERRNDYETKLGGCVTLKQEIVDLLPSFSLEPQPDGLPIYSAAKTYTPSKSIRIINIGPAADSPEERKLSPEEEWMSAAVDSLGKMGDFTDRGCCPVAGGGGFHSDSFGEDGTGACAWCGSVPPHPPEKKKARVKAPEDNDPVPRPTFTSFVVRVPTLVASLEEAVEILGKVEAIFLRRAFEEGSGTRGIWALPHPDAEREVNV